MVGDERIMVTAKADPADGAVALTVTRGWANTPAAAIST